MVTKFARESLENGGIVLGSEINPASYPAGLNSTIRVEKGWQVVRTPDSRYVDQKNTRRHNQRRIAKTIANEATASTGSTTAGGSSFRLAEHAAVAHAVNSQSIG